MVQMLSGLICHRKEESERGRISGKRKHRIYFQSDIWADIDVVFIGHSQFLSAKPIKSTVFKNSVSITVGVDCLCNIMAIFGKMCEKRSFTGQFT